MPGSISDEKKKKIRQLAANPMPDVLLAEPKAYVDRDGFVKFPDGSRFKGPLHKGLPEGIGSIIYPDGSSYEGDWRSGMSHGFGLLKFTDGSYYEGMWSRGKY